MRIVFLVLFALIAFVLNQNLDAAEAPKNLQTFVTDGCTLFIDGPADKPDLWKHCCYEHDLRYWFGGAKEDKNFSDIQLRECVKNVAGNFWANLIYNGVRAGSFSPIKFKYVWSWGWEPKRGKGKLDKAEIDYVIIKLNELDLDPQFKEAFFHKYLNTSSSN